MKQNCDIGLVFNPQACGGKAKQIPLDVWKKELSQKLAATLQDLSTAQKVESFILSGGRNFLVIGGDGSFNWLLNVLIPICQKESLLLSDMCIGGIGVGSSNDFHKSPFIKPGTTWHQFPAHLNYENKKMSDVLEIYYPQEDQTKYALLNVSVGLTAQANEFFNRPYKLWKFIKKISTTFAIYWAALEGVIKFLAPVIHIQTRIKSQNLQIMNLGIVKNPHFAGDFYYPQLVEAHDGMFGVFIIPKLSKIKTMTAMSLLENGEFLKIPQATSAIENYIHIQCQKSVPIELDGEVSWAQQAIIRVHAQPVGLCT